MADFKIHSAVLENCKGHAGHCQLRELFLKMALCRCGLPAKRFHIVLLGLVCVHEDLNGSGMPYDQMDSLDSTFPTQLQHNRCPQETTKHDIACMHACMFQWSLPTTGEWATLTCLCKTSLVDDSNERLIKSRPGSKLQVMDIKRYQIELQSEVGSIHVIAMHCRTTHYFHNLVLCHFAEKLSPSPDVNIIRGSLAGWHTSSHVLGNNAGICTNDGEVPSLEIAASSRRSCA